VDDIGVGAKAAGPGRRVGAAIAGAVVLMLSMPSSALAHAYLVRSSPVARAVVTSAPERVQLWFNERLEPAYARISIWNAGGQRVDAGDGQVDIAEPTRLSVGAPGLPAGLYTVKYRVLSVDGHIVEAAFTFTVRPAR
jgi:methionine-rich copper-binding protein CopC